MKQSLRLLFTLLLLVVYGGVCVGQTFKKVTEQSDIVADGEYLIVNEDAAKAYGGVNSDNIGTAVDVTISNSTISNIGNAHIVKIGGETDKWTLYDETDQKYLAYTSKATTKNNNLFAISSETSDGTTWEITPTTITNIYNTKRKLQYNSGATRFACYTGSQKDVVLYKKESSSKTSTTLSFGADFDGKTITKNINDIFETPATLSPTIEGATITYKSSSPDVAEIEGGVIETKKEGTTTITASYAGDDNYEASSISYTLKVVDNRTATTLTFPTTSYTYNQGDKDGEDIIENPATLTPANAGTVAYSVSGTTSIVSGNIDSDGIVVINTNNVGTATITASFAGNNTYKPSTASYTITVKKVEQIEDGVFDFTDGTLTYGSGLTPKNNYGSTEYEKSTTWNAGNITIETTGNTRWYKTTSSNELRFYKGSSLTINAPEGFAITNIAFTGAYSFKADEGNYNTNNGKWTGNANKITFSYNAQSGNIGVKTITVKYVKTESLTTAASGFATYAASYPVNYKESGLTAYAVKVSSDNTKVSYTKLEDGVPANIAVLVQGASEQTVTLTPASTTASSVDTDLQMSDGSIIGDGSLIYGFATKDGVSGFYRVKNGITVPANKGYIKLSNPSDAKFFSFDGGNGTTGIGNIENIEKQIMLDNATIYNLAGQRVSKSYKGVIIVNGKKMVNK